MLEWAAHLSEYVREHLWPHFQLVQPAANASANIFGLAEYLAALALFIVILTTSDFRYRHRLALTRFDLQRIGFGATFLIGLLILFVDVWFANGLPVPRLLSNQVDLKAALGAAFMLLLLQIFHVALISPPVFGRRNAERFFGVHYRLIHEGNPEKLVIVAEELRRSVQQIVRFAADSPRGQKGEGPPTVHAFAHDFLLLLGERRFCNLVVDKMPGTALAFIHEFQRDPRAKLPIFQFVRNVGQQFISNTTSAYYQEESGYHSGYLGYDRPITRTVFGDYEFVEGCAGDGASPLELDYLSDSELGRKQMEGMSRAGLAFLESYLKATKGRRYNHSYGLYRLLHFYERSALIGLHAIDGRSDYSKDPAFQRYYATAEFARDAIKLAQEHAAPPSGFRANKEHPDIYDLLADMVFEIVIASTSVASPEWTAWDIQHNSGWAHIFGFDRTKASAAVHKRVCRLLYEEIKRMDKWPNFKGARALGFCLLVLGLSPIDRRKGHRREDSPLQSVAARWAVRNYARLLEDHPEVANACLLGSVTYDHEGGRFVKTFAGRTGREPNRQYLAIDRGSPEVATDPVKRSKPRRNRMAAAQK